MARPLLPHWTAGTDGTAHVTVGKGQRTLCQRRPTAEQFAWPAERRCPECAATLQALEREVATA